MVKGFRVRNVPSAQSAQTIDNLGPGGLLHRFLDPNYMRFRYLDPWGRDVQGSRRLLGACM